MSRPHSPPVDQTEGTLDNISMPPGTIYIAHVPPPVVIHSVPHDSLLTSQANTRSPSPVTYVDDQEAQQEEEQANTSKSDIIILPVEETPHYDMRPKNRPVLSSYKDGKVDESWPLVMVPTANKRLQLSEGLKLRRDRISVLFRWMFEARGTRLDLENSRIAPPAAYEYHATLDEAIEAVFYAHQVRYGYNDESVGYCINPDRYTKLIAKLDTLHSVYSQRVQDINGKPLIRPSWARDYYSQESPEEVWGSQEFEVLAVKFREDIETYLSTIYSCRLRTPSPKLSRRVLRQRTEDHDHYTQSEVPTVGMTTAPEFVASPSPGVAEEIDTNYQGARISPVAPNVSPNARKEVNPDVSSRRFEDSPPWIYGVKHQQSHPIRSPNSAQASDKYSRDVPPHLGNVPQYDAISKGKQREHVPSSRGTDVHSPIDNTPTGNVSTGRVSESANVKATREAIRHYATDPIPKENQYVTPVEKHMEQVHVVQDNIPAQVKAKVKSRRFGELFVNPGRRASTMTIQATSTPVKSSIPNPEMYLPPSISRKLHPTRRSSQFQEPQRLNLFPPRPKFDRDENEADDEAELLRARVNPVQHRQVIGEGSVHSHHGSYVSRHSQPRLQPVAGGGGGGGDEPSDGGGSDNEPPINGNRGNGPPNNGNRGNGLPNNRDGNEQPGNQPPVPPGGNGPAPGGGGGGQPPSPPSTHHGVASSRSSRSSDTSARFDIAGQRDYVQQWVQQGPQPGQPQPQVHARRLGEYHFDRKLKMEIVPIWNGNTDKLTSWLLEVNELSERSPSVFEELGQIVPLRLRDGAYDWYWSLPMDFRHAAQRDWETLRAVICGYYMNRTWLERQKSRANVAAYRDREHPNEWPSEYLIRKKSLLELVYEMTDSELIQEVMSKAPLFWTRIIDTYRYNTFVDFQNSVKYHEEALKHDSSPNESALERRLRALEQAQHGRSGNRPWMQGNQRGGYNRPPNRPNVPNPHNAAAHLAGWSPSLEKPKWPRDDTIVSKGRTPEMKGARPCRYCGSPKHWDMDCRHAKKGAKNVRTNFANPTQEYTDAQKAYDDLYYATDSDDEPDPNFTADDQEGSDQEAHENSQQDFHEPPSCQTFLTQHVNPDMRGLGGLSTLGGSEDSNGSSSVGNLDSETGNGTHVLNRKQRRALWRKCLLTMGNSIPPSSNSLPKGEAVYLEPVMSRPPGTTFLGSKATSLRAKYNDEDGLEIPIILDSGSDITLISHKTLNSISNGPKIKTGQRINLVQVTGNSTISGFVSIPLYFSTNDGPVIITVDAYVVKGMNTPFILGNDFADQYQLSLIRKNGVSFVQFGNSGRNIPVDSSVGPTAVDDEGHTFRAMIRPEYSMQRHKQKLHHKNQKRRRHYITKEGLRVVAAETVTIPPESVVKVSVTTLFPENVATLYVEKLELRNREGDAFFGAPDSHITKDDPYLQVANFTDSPIVIEHGRQLGWGHNPHTWLDEMDKLPPSVLEKQYSHAQAVQSMVSDLLKKDSQPISQDDDNKGEPELPGGPKTSETADPEPVPRHRLLQELNFSPDLTSEQRKALEELALRHEKAFGLDGRLGHYNSQVKIPLRPGAKEISVPPFQQSPEKRQVIDKQMDTWLATEVIEPSKSPWGFPAFIVYRNNKPRMVVDYRKLNAVTIPDEFPLPRQEEILHALSGAQWLSTLDALAGFTQLEMAEEDREKTAFRTHRGLYQFKRMPFGLRNGPSIFQRVTQSILAPYLWIFTLVYIDDIVVFSVSFMDHLGHLEVVFIAVERAGITLSPSKCFLGYQSLLLLGQKVSRLGLSTHKEKIDAIIDLKEPRNISELQTFLGMMVYFLHTYHSMRGL